MQSTISKSNKPERTGLAVDLCAELGPISVRCSRRSSEFLSGYRVQPIKNVRWYLASCFWDDKGEIH